MRLRGFLSILTTACMFGLGAVLAKLLGEAFTPFFVSWLALLGGGLFVFACQVLRRKPLLPRLTTRASRVDLLLFASIGTALPLVCVIVGLPQTSAITGSFLLQLQAPAALIFALVLLKEKITRKQLVGIALLLVGSLLVILRNLHGPLEIKGGQGDVFVLIAAVGIGFAYIPGKRLTGQGDALQINLLRLFVASCFLLPFLALQTNGLIVPFSWSVIGVLVIYIVANFGIGYILLQVGLSLLQAWEASVITLTLPLFATVFAVLLLHESLTLLQIVGGGIILVGGFLVI
ncbi:MAG: DMT family transporter [Chloroflexi bacterium]|nr:DMT family transporter [Chloroflexota bacterium]